MYDVLQVKEIFETIIPDIKKIKSQKIKDGKELTIDDYPNFYPNYKLAIEYMNKCKVHSELGEFPLEIFMSASPNLTPKEKMLLKSSYKHTTLPVFIDFVNTITRPLSDGNWSISGLNDELKEYVDNDIKYYGSLETFFKTILPIVRSIDANGCIVVKPEHIAESEKGQYDDTEKLKPIPFYYSCDQKIAFKEDEYYIFILKERSMVEFAGKNQPYGLVFEFYDKNAIYRISQTGKQTDFKFNIELFLQHDRGKIPVKTLGGIPVLKNGSLLYQSVFMHATDLLDVVALNATYQNIIIRKCAFPYMVMIGEECKYTEEGDAGVKMTCNEGWLVSANFSGGKKVCPDCNGSGLKNRISPMGVLILKPSNERSQGETQIKQEPLAYVAPDVKPLEFLETKIEKDTIRARSLLHINQGTISISVAKTATEIATDQKALFAFVKNEVYAIFTIFDFMINTTGYFRDGQNYSVPLINYPVSYDFKTDADYVAEIQKIKEAGLPSFVLLTTLMRYLGSLYYNSGVAESSFNLIVSADRILTMDTLEMERRKSAGLIDDWEIVLHDSSINFVNDLFKKNDKFFEQEFEIQKQQLIDYAKAKAAELEKSNSNKLVNEFTPTNQE